MAGGLWRAARRRADRALAHFHALEQAVASPISAVPRHYWQGPRAGGCGDEPAPTAWRAAADYRRWYVGSLPPESWACLVQPALGIPGPAGDAPEMAAAAFCGKNPVRAGVWLIAAGDPDPGPALSAHLAETATPGISAAWRG